jgi:glycerophosphoryl diester phosphodiesterase
MVPSTGFLLRRLPLLFALLLHAEAPSGERRVILIAHRGEHRRHPENTVSAIEGAVSAGVDYVEMDVRRSRDGVHVLMHDATVDRTTDGQGRVSELDWEALSKLIVRTTGPEGGPTDRIPRLESALQACKGRIRIYLDFKSGDILAVAAMIRDAGMTGSVVVYDSPSKVAMWREALPGVEFILSVPTAARTNRTELESFVKRHRPKALDTAADAAFVAECRRLGVENWPDAQRESEDPTWWSQVLSAGVRGFQTDHPAEAARWLRDRGQAAGPTRLPSRPGESVPAR